ncbi:glycosyltransferase family 4 protein [Patescibacteria group bacterium]|nr:glycosyltransferase family 4 protein [Patescibacteria group bacterium]
MLIGIDANEANADFRVGIGQYAFQLLRHIYFLRKNKYKELELSNVSFRIYLKNRPRDDMPVTNSWWDYEIFGPPKAWTQVALPFKLFIQRPRPDIFFSPSHYSPRFAPCPCAMSIMDLSFINFPEMFRKKDLYQLTRWTEYSVKKAAKVFTISYYSKKSIVEYYKVRDDKVVVTYPGYDSDVFNTNEKRNERLEERLKKKYHLSDNFILFVGTLQPRKNIKKLIEAFEKIIMSGDKTNLQLVIIGKKGWLFEDILEAIKTSRVVQRIIVTDYVLPLELPLFYHMASCFVLPSLYEGFGLPVVEAMACGCPVVVSNNSSLPEIIWKSGLLVDPEDSKDIARGIKSVIYDKELRSRMVVGGHDRIKVFSWEKCALQTLKVLQETVTDIK